MAASKWRQDLRAIRQKEPDSDVEFEAFNDAIHADKESSRGVALVAGAMADTALVYVLKARLAPMNKSSANDLFEPDGIMGSFGSRIKMAHAFGVIDEHIRNDLDRVREVRNTFAHAWVYIDFDTPSIARACSNFNISMPSYFTSIDTPKNRYTNICFCMLDVAAEQMRHADLRHFKKLKELISVESVIALREKSLKRFLRRTQ